MITIIGAGLSGLSLAYHLQKAGAEYLLIESSEEAGGYIKTAHKEGCVLELGPNSILCDEWLISFLKELGIENEMLPSNEVSKARYIFKNRKYRRLPENPLKLLFGNFFSLSTKLKILREPFAPIVEKQDETLEEFFTRRFGKEVYDYALTPFITGIYAGDPKSILLEETFPLIKEYERKFGSVLKGFIKNKPGRKQTYSFKQGMQTLPKALASNIKNIRYNSNLTSLKKVNKGFILEITSGEKTEEFHTDQLVFTSPAFAIEGLLRDWYPDFSKALSKVYYPPVCAVHSVYEKSKVGHSLNGFGGLNPKKENLFTSGSIWSSSVFKGRCQEDKVLFTSFVGGALSPENTELPESFIKEKVNLELKKNFNISEDPQFQHLVKWNKSIPQYTKELKEAKEYLPELEKDHIFFCTNWINGVSLPDCIKKGKQLSDKIINLATN